MTNAHALMLRYVISNDADMISIPKGKYDVASGLWEEAVP